MRAALLVLTLLVIGCQALQLRPVGSLPARPMFARRVPRHRMQAEEEVEPVAQAAPSEGYETFYDDEKEDAVLAAKPPISDSMRARLLKEQQGLGADSNSKNPFLLVFAGVGVFVILGALAVNM